MDYINTTHTAVQKLKREAKLRRKTSNVPLNEALEEVARESGYSNWKHVTVCLAASRTQGDQAEQQALPLENGAAAQASASPAIVSAHRRRPFIAELAVGRLQAGIYEYKASCGGHELFTDAGFASITDALRSASDITGDIRGFEVSYGGVVVGTYPVEELHQTADAVAERAVRTVSALGAY